MNQNTCPKCQTEVSENAKFCPVCGSPIESPAPAANTAAPEKPKKKKRLRNFVIFIAIIAVIVGVSKISSAIKSRIDWDEIVLGEMIPTPPVTKGEVVTNTAGSFYASISGVSPKQYVAYADECAENGYNIDVDSDDTSYDALNKEGYSLSLDYYTSSEELIIDLEKPEKEETTKPSKTETTTEKQAETTAEKQTEESTTKKQSSSSVSSDFKKTMDEYEKFMNKYIDFMKDYAENPTDLSLIADYAKMISDYADYCDEIDEIDEDELSDADLAYMLEVTARVEKRVLEELD